MTLRTTTTPQDSRHPLCVTSWTTKLTTNSTTLTQQHLFLHSNYNLTQTSCILHLRPTTVLLSPVQVHGPHLLELGGRHRLCLCRAARTSRRITCTRTTLLLLRLRFTRMCNLEKTNRTRLTAQVLSLNNYYNLLLPQKLPQYKSNRQAGRHSVRILLMFVTIRVTTDWTAAKLGARIAIASEDGPGDTPRATQIRAYIRMNLSLTKPGSMTFSFENRTPTSPRRERGIRICNQSDLKPG